MPERQCLLTYTVAKFIPTEGKYDIRDALIILLLPLKSGTGKVRIDCGPGIACLVDDARLAECGINLELGRVKNVNKNPVAEKAIRELGDEILKLQPRGGPIVELVLAKATALLNSRIRRDGLSPK